MRKKRAPSSNILNRASLFGPPPLLEGEDPAAYDQMVTLISNAVKPTDFIEEIWARDLADTAWSLFRLRRIQAAYLSAKVWDIANDKASSLAEAEPELMEGPEKEEMSRLLSSDSDLSWESLATQNPRAYEKFQNFWASAKATLDMEKIQADVMVRGLDTIERIERLIMLAEQRFDAIVRELDRHRITQKLRDGVQEAEEAEFKTVITKPNIRKITSKKAA
jgi:hypothetical protein